MPIRRNLAFAGMLRPLSAARSAMPFDGTNFPHPPPPERGRSDMAVSIAIVAIAFALLVMPISLATLIDLIRYFRG